MLMVQDSVIYLHIPKTGGTFCREFLREHYPTIAIGKKHESLARLPEMYSHLPVIASIRNPLTWYVSLYQYFTTKYTNYPVVQAASNFGMMGMYDTIYNLLEPDNGTVERYNVLMRDSVPTNINHISTFDEMLSDDTGLYTWIYNELTYLNDSVILMRQESLVDDLSEVLNGMNMLTAFQNDQLRSFNQVNCSDSCHDVIIDEYLLDLIKHKDRLIFELVGHNIYETITY